jgi:hypothetical protein
MTDITDIIAPPVSAEPEDPTLERAPESSILGTLRAKRAQAAPDEPLVVPLSVYDGELAIRFQYPETGWERLRDIGARVEQAGGDKLAELWAMCDLIASCCDEILTREGSAWVGDPNQPLRFTRRMGEGMGLDLDEVKSPVRWTVRHFFSPRAQETGVFRGDMALANVGVKLQRWLEGEQQADAERFVGES